MLEFYRSIKEINPDHRNIALTILDGAFAGEKALVSDGRLVWNSAREGMFACCSPERLAGFLEGVRGSGISVWAGESGRSSPGGGSSVRAVDSGHEGGSSVRAGGSGQEGGSSVRAVDSGQGSGSSVRAAGSGREDVRVFCDVLASEKKIVLCGGGHVSIPIIRISRMMGCPVWVLEDRPLFADNARRAGANQVFCEPFDQGLARIAGDRDTFFVIVTRGHRYDQVCLEAIAKKPHAYIGMIGSRRRVALVKETLIAGGSDPRVIDSIYAPIGLDIGAETPEEIGVAVMAEIIQVGNREQRSGGYTRELLAAILKAGEEGSPQVLTTIISRKGSAPRKTGTKMLVLPDGTCTGTIGGGCAESAVMRQALAMLRTGGPERSICPVNMTGEDAEDQGMVCGGTMEVLLERIAGNKVIDGGYHV